MSEWTQYKQYYHNQIQENVCSIRIRRGTRPFWEITWWILKRKSRIWALLNSYGLDLISKDRLSIVLLMTVFFPIRKFLPTVMWICRMYIEFVSRIECSRWRTLSFIVCLCIWFRDIWMMKNKHWPSLLFNQEYRSVLYIRKDIDFG